MADPQGDFVRYLKDLVVADNVQHFVEKNPFVQSAILEQSSDWKYYSGIAEDLIKKRK